MSKEIEAEQKKLAEHLNGLPVEERQKQGMALMCWLQGYEAGYQSARNGDQNGRQTVPRS